jgi:hypothetical protein
VNIRRIKDLAVIVIVFVLVGPLVGLAVYSALAFGTFWADSGLSYALQMTALGIFFGLPRAHVWGAPYALAAGLVVAAVSALRGAMPVSGPLVVGALTWGTQVVVNAQQIPLLGQEIHNVYRIWLPIHIVSAIVCWWLTRSRQAGAASAVDGLQG